MISRKIKDHRINCVRCRGKKPRQAKWNVEMHEFQTSVSTPEGNTSVKVPGTLDDAEARRDHETVISFNTLQEAGGFVLKAGLEEVKAADASVWGKELSDLLTAHRLVPEDRIAIYSRAIEAVIAGDGMTFAHLIIPQLENSIRLLAGTKRVRVTKLLVNGTHQERDINELLYEQGIIDALGEDLVWELRTLLIHQAGPNLRNRVCHGLQSAASFEAPRFSFLAWLALHFLATTR